MESILLGLLLIVIFFILLLIIKQFLPKSLQHSFCVICGAVSLTWISLLILLKIGLFTNKMLIALLMGQTIVGLYYAIEKKTKKDMYIFRLPFLLTATVIAYTLIEYPENIVFKSMRIPYILLGIIWLIFVILYKLNKTAYFKKLINAIIKCCKNW